MREGWTYKKLGEVATIIGGSTPKSNIEEYWGGSHYWVTPADLKGNKYQGATPRTITNLAIQKTNLQLLPIGTVLLSSRAPIGKVAITTVPMYCNQGFKNVVCSEQLLNEFVYWYLLNKTDYLNSLGRGATFKEISKKATEQIPIPIPPLSEQQRIVSELDLLSSIIEKKKAQLKEYDQLAQSIFYDMFGDPVTNEKGWDILELSTICDVRDGTHDSPKYVEIGYPLITSKNVINGTISFENVNLISEDDLNAINVRSRVDEGDIIMPMIGTIGNPVVVHKSREFAIKNVALIKFSKSNLVINIYIQKLLDSDIYSNFIKEQNRGGTQKFVSLKAIRQLPIPLPPLSLQQSFASKIEAIERQKALLQQSITEAETLFNSRMDFWFS